MDIFTQEEMLGYVSVVSAAARASRHWVGRGDSNAADHAAVEAMRVAFNDLPIQGKIVIGEGERDQAPMLFIGEELGAGGVARDIAVDPLECTTQASLGCGGALSVLAVSERGGLLMAPDLYMEKIMIRSGLSAEWACLDRPIEETILGIAAESHKPVSEVVVSLLNRERHRAVIDRIYAIGAKAYLIPDGDVAVAFALDRHEIDLYWGCGGAPEGVIAASILSCLGGAFQGRLVFSNDDDRRRAALYDIFDTRRLYNMDDIVLKSVAFALAGVTSGSLLEGVSQQDSLMRVNCIYGDSITRSYRKEWFEVR